MLQQNKTKKKMNENERKVASSKGMPMKETKHRRSDVCMRQCALDSCVPSGYFDGGKGTAAAVGAEQWRMVSMMATLTADSLAEKSSARPCKTFMS